MAILKCSACSQRTTDKYTTCENCGRRIDGSFEWIGGPRTPAHLRVGASPTEEMSQTEAVMRTGRSARFRTSQQRELEHQNRVQGAIWLIGGVVVTVGTYASAAPGGTYVVAWGAILFGIVKLIRGVGQSGDG
jgi:hypothetical protein